MKHNLIILLTVMMFTFSVKSQYSKSSIEPRFGITKVQDVTPFRLFNTNIGYRYMANTKFGAKVDLGYSRLYEQHEYVGEEYPINYISSSFHGVTNVGRLLEFESFTDWYTILFELGGTYVYSDGKTQGEQLFNRYSTFHLSSSINNEFKLTKGIFLNAELDYIADVNNRPFLSNSTETTNLFNINLGITISLNHSKEHADWYITPKLVDTLFLKPTIIDKTVTKRVIYPSTNKGKCNCDIIENVFFKHDSFNVDKDGLNAIVKTADKLTGSKKIYIKAYCSPPGTNEYNMTLAQKRAESVESKLISLGIEKHQIIKQYHGEVNTADGKNVDLARTVTIYVK